MCDIPYNLSTKTKAQAEGEKEMANYNYSKEVEQAKAEGLVPYFVVREAKYDTAGCEVGSSIISFGKEFELEESTFNNFEDGNLTVSEKELTNLVFELVAIDKDIEAEGEDSVENALYRWDIEDCEAWGEHIITIDERGL